MFFINAIFLTCVHVCDASAPKSGAKVRKIFEMYKFICKKLQIFLFLSEKGLVCLQKESRDLRLSSRYNVSGEDGMLYGYAILVDGIAR